MNLTIQQKLLYISYALIIGAGILVLIAILSDNRKELPALIGILIFVIIQETRNIKLYKETNLWNNL